MGIHTERMGTWRFWLAALGSGLIFDYLFYDKIAGVSVLLAVIYMYGVYLWSLGDWRRWKSRLGWGLLAPIGLLSAAYAWHDNDVLRMLNSVVLVGLILWQTQLFARAVKEDPRTLGPIAIIKQAIGGTLRHFLQPWKKIQQALSRKERGSDSKQVWKTLARIVGGCLLAAPLLAIVVSLLSSADEAFGQILLQVPEWLKDWKFQDWFWRVVAILLTGTYIFSYIWGMGTHTTVQAEADKASSVRFTLDGIMSGTVLLLLNVVFVIFVIIQFTYLFGGTGSGLPAGLTYAEYARSGFGELVAVTLLNFSLMWIVLRHLDRGGRIRVWWHKCHLLLMTLCSAVMLASAVKRLTLYEQAYGFTVIRLMVFVFLLALSFMFIVMLYHIWRDDRLSLIPYLIIGIVFYVGLNYVNIERIVAERNVERYELTGKLDTAYLSNLSYGVVEPLLKLRADASVGPTINDILDALHKQANEPVGWQAANWSRWRAAHLLE